MAMTATELARELIAIPSHEDPSAAGEAIATWLEEETDAEVERDAVGNIIARRGSGKQTLALVGHHDVVPPASAQVDDRNYRVETVDGRLFGRGAADMKGSVAAAMLAFRDADPAIELVFASFVGEETGGEGARHAIAEGFAPDHAVICEGSTGYSASGVTDVVIAHRGRLAHALTTYGKAAHAGEPDAGENAIVRACQVLSEIDALQPPSVDIAGEELTGSISVTEISGGDASNVVPARCEAMLDERTVPDRGSILQLNDENAELEQRQETPAMRCSDAMFAGHVLRVADRVQTGSPRHVTKPHATDAGYLARTGTACVIVGAAEPGEAHTDAESVSIEAIDRCRRCYEELASSWSAGTDQPVS